MVVVDVMIHDCGGRDDDFFVVVSSWKDEDEYDRLDIDYAYELIFKCFSFLFFPVERFCFFAKKFIHNR